MRVGGPHHDPGAGPGPDPGPGVRIRPMTHDDFPDVMAIERAAFTVPWTRATFRGLLERKRTGLWVAEAEGRVVGYAVVWAVLDQAELGNVAVAEAYRRRGVATRLVDTVVQWLQGQGVEPDGTGPLPGAGLHRRGPPEGVLQPPPGGRPGAAPGDRARVERSNRLTRPYLGGSFPSFSLPHWGSRPGRAVLVRPRASTLRRPARDT